ncbi:DNA cytosine methyltransferase [bacterium]|nr:MAG: DNA cytosine methyltransferase [bacterium]
MEVMNELSLFSGAGGGLLGTMLLGFRPIGYVEWDDYCQRVLAARIRDGILPDAPIFGDIKTFINSGCAELYRGVTDVITAGFPCQPFSVAGKQKGADDERNMWPLTATVIGIVKPRFVLLENVPGVRSYLPVVVRDLRRLGYEVSRPLILGADDVGAPHRRKRVWIHARNTESNTSNQIGEIWQGEDTITGGICQNVAHSPMRQDDGRKRGELDGAARGREGIYSAADSGGQDVAHADETGRGEQRRTESIQPEYDPLECSGSWWASDPADTVCIYGDDAGHGTGEVCRECGQTEICGLSRWGLESRVGRVANGVASRVDRLKAIGNGQVPRVVAAAWRILVG